MPTDLLADGALDLLRSRTGRALLFDFQLELLRKDGDRRNLWIDALRHQELVHNVADLLAGISQTQLFIAVTIAGDLGDKAELLQIASKLERGGLRQSLVHRCRELPE